MTSSIAITRRRITQQLVALIGFTTFSALLNERYDSGDPNQDLLRAASEIISNTDSAAIIGMAYLTLFPAERSAEILTYRLRKGLRSKQTRVDAEELLATIRADFATGNLVNLHGWRLSRTEGRLCALYAAKILS